MPNSSPFVASVNELLAKLEDNPTVDTGIELANQIVSLFGDVHTKSVEDVFESSIELPNAERYDSWFQPHPIFKSDRACFDLADSPLLQAKFYWLKKRSRQIIAGGVHFTPNYEDEEFTHNERYKVGLDFFLSPNGKSLQVVLSNRGNLRIVELAGRLNNTQKEIFEKWLGAGSLNTQEALHTTLWESFKLKSVNQKFYDGVSNSFTELLQHLKSIDKDEEEAKLFASRLLGRLLFCWFLRKKGIIDESIGYFNAHGADATAYYKQSLERLFFLTLNTPVDERDELTKQHQKALFPELLVDDQPSLFKTDQKTPYLNGGLFEPHENDWYKDDSLTLPEGFFTNLYDHFEEFNFTTDESSPEYEQIAIDPEMLGRVFESLLATQVDETGQQARKAKGAFYTPREIVSYMCKESLRNYLYNAVNNDEGTRESIDSLLDITDSEWAKSKSNTLRDKVKDNRTQIIDALDAVTILDPACGSGAFPMGMLQLMLKTYERLESRFDPYKTKLSVIQNNIFGVDIEPMAVEISRLRAWLSLIVDEDDPRSVDPLPNLDFKFVCANSLVPLDKEMGLFSDSSLHQKLKDIRTKYFNARKKHTKKALQDEYYKLTSSEQTSLITDDNRTKQLKSFDPFKNSQPANFFDEEHMFGLSEGFRIVIGNPPYSSKQSKKTKELLPFYNYVEYKCDPYAIFIEMGLNCASQGGILTYITPLSWMTNHYYMKLRKFLVDSNSLHIAALVKGKVFESANVDNSIIVLKKNSVENSKYLWKIIDASTLDAKYTERSYDEVRDEPRYEVSPYDDGWKLIKSRIEKNTTQLGQISKISLGMKLKSNDKYTTGIQTEDFPDPIIFGKDISRYSQIIPQNFFNFDTAVIIGGTKNRQIQLHKPKIFIQAIRNLSLKRRIIATLDQESHCFIGTLNSVIINDSKYEPYYILALINSKLLNTYFTNRFTTISLTASTLGTLPIKIPSLDNEAAVDKIVELSKNIMNTNLSADEFKKLDDEIDREVYKLYDLEDSEIKAIEEA